MIRKILLAAAAALTLAATPALAAVDVTDFELAFSFAGSLAAGLVYPDASTYSADSMQAFFADYVLNKSVTYSFSDSGASAYASISVDDLATFYSTNSGYVTLFSNSVAYSTSANGIYAIAKADVSFNEALITFTLNQPTAYLNGQMIYEGFNGIDLYNNGYFSLTDAVPEVGTWEMMLLGFAVVGFAMRGRPKVAFSYA